MVDGSITVHHDNPASGHLLSDTLRILASKEIKVTGGGGRGGRAGEDGEDAAAAAGEEREGGGGLGSASAAADNSSERGVTGRLLSKVAKRNILENIVPILLELKSLLEKDCSPYLRQLMWYA
jgi:condensin-2 complex subunit D3